MWWRALALWYGCGAPDTSEKERGPLEGQPGKCGGERGRSVRIKIRQKRKVERAERGDSEKGE